MQTLTEQMNHGDNESSFADILHDYQMVLDPSARAAYTQTPYPDRVIEAAFTEIFAQTEALNLPDEKNCISWAYTVLLTTALRQYQACLKSGACVALHNGELFERLDSVCRNPEISPY